MVLFIPLNVYSISASSMVVMDSETRRILNGYNYNDKRLIASITKIMTSIVAIEYGNLDDVVEVTDIVKESFGSGIYINPGEKITLRDLLYGLMLRSGNDAALMIAEHVSGSVESFVYLMNEYASKIGMKNTLFLNPHGLENNEGKGNISTSFDMALLTSYAIQNSTFKTIFSTKNYTAKSSTKTYKWHNKNKLLRLDYITGGKTGFTEKARRTLVTTAKKDNISLVIVTLNDPNDFEDHESLYNKTFDTYESIEVINKSKFKVKDDTHYKDGILFIKNNYRMTLNKKEIKNISLDIELIKYDDYNNDDIVGYVKVKLKDEVYHKEPIYVRKIVKSDKSIFQKLKGWFSW